MNTLGMVFKPVPGTEVSFCIWETRVKDYAAYATASAGVDGTWEKPYGSPWSQSAATFRARAGAEAEIHPVAMVSWEDAVAFCEWLTKMEMAAAKIKSGQKYRLPTDAEWSVAVGTGKYPWGNTYPAPKGAGNYYKWVKADSYEYTSPVGSFAANKLGLYDMGGNVWEWCEDWYNPATKRWRVLRGASKEDSGGYVLSSSYRKDIGRPIGRANYIGFRCVLVGE